jgi:iron complex transport system substrate-binding protein
MRIMLSRTPKFSIPIALGVLQLLWSVHAIAAVSVVDDARHIVTLSAPAQRIVSLAPHATELLFAAGAGAKIVGVSEYSNYPPAAVKIASIGNTFSLDLERIIALKPDLIVMWGSGNSAGQTEKLRNLGIPLFESEPRDYETVATSLERLSRLTGTDKTGRAAATAFRARRDRITAFYQRRAPVSVFYQIWHDPLMTLNDEHMVSQAIHLCGGTNIFGKLPALTPTVSVEAVLKADPEVIVSGSSAKNDAMVMWHDFPKLTAVTRDNLFLINSDLLTRAGPRILDGTEMLCKRLEEARSKRR